MLRLLLLSSPLPALIIGILVMQRSTVNQGIWVQQLVAGFTIMGLCAALSFVPRLRRPLGFPIGEISVVVALLLLAATLAQPGLEGVRRWVPIGPLQLNAAFVALPILLVAFGMILAVAPRRTWVIPLATAIAAIVLMLQPDPSQATAFGAAVVVLLLLRSSPTSRDWLTVGIILLAAIVAWTRPDPLPSVPYVEGIVGLAGNLGTVWVAASLLALALLPIPFIADALRNPHGSRASLAAAVYFAIVSSVPLLGPYPVPVLGFGLSPLVGYCAVLGWVVLRSPADRSARIVYREPSRLRP
jgi:cell division protein FtsW (lipid II flippase)